MRLKKTLGLAVLALLLGAGESFAYTWNKCGSLNLKWSTASATMRASQVGFPSGSTWRTALGSVATRWNNTPTKMRYTMLYDDTSVALNNGQNEIWWQSDPGAPAITYWWYNSGTCTFTETDIIFDNTEAYTTSTTQSALWPYGGASRPFQTTAMHEFGHAQGLGHTATLYNIMGQDWTHIHGNCGVATAYPGEDAMAGSVTVYGKTTSPKEDLGMAHWRWTGASGEYSTHGRTRLFDSAGVELVKWATSPEPIYRVNKGQVVQLEMTYENMGGSNSLVPNIRYYVSTNNCISNLDTLLTSTSFNLNRDTPYTSKRNVTIPGSLASGQTYWLGVIIDEPSAFTEYYEANNATYLAIRVN